MKKVAFYAIAVLLLAGVFFGIASANAPQLQAASLSEGSYPSPALHREAPQQSMIPGEGSYPSPACSPSNPRCKGMVVPELKAGEGSYPSPACSPSNPRCSGSGPGGTPGTSLTAGEGSYPSPACSPSNPRCKGMLQPTRSVALLGDGAAPMPLYPPSGGLQ